MVRVHSSRYLKLELDTNGFQLLFCYLTLFGNKIEQEKRIDTRFLGFSKKPFIFVRSPHCFVSTNEINNEITFLAAKLM